MGNAKNENGYALITVIMFSMIMIIAGLAYYKLGDIEEAVVQTDVDFTQALYAAESGREKVCWATKKHKEIIGLNVNPFHPDWYGGGASPARVTDLINVVNPKAGEGFLPGTNGKAYFKTVDARGQGNRILVKILGGIDNDGDGINGLIEGDIESFNDADPDDTNRFFECYIGLGNSLGHNVSAAAKNGFVDKNKKTIGFQIYKEWKINNNLVSTYVDNNSKPGILFSIPVETGSDGNDIGVKEVNLPLNLFDKYGAPVEGYFADCDYDKFAGNKTFQGESFDGKHITFVDGNIYLTEMRSFSDSWKGKDVVMIATDTIYWGVNKGDEGNPDRWSSSSYRIPYTDINGRLTLIAKNIYLHGEKDTNLNGILCAGNDIILDGDGKLEAACSVFAGVMVAGNQIRNEDDGWAIIFNKNVINGTIETRSPLNYDDMENKNTQNKWDDPPDVNPPHWWLDKGSCRNNHDVDWGDLGADFTEQKRYSSLENTTNKADSSDHMGCYSYPFSENTYPNCMKVNILMRSFGDDFYGDMLKLRLKYGTFCDKKIELIKDKDNYHNWSIYRDIGFWMKLDNWKKGTTYKNVILQFKFRNSDDNWAKSVIDENFYGQNNWGNHSPFEDDPSAPYEYDYNSVDDPQWKYVRLNFLNDFEYSASSFDFEKIYILYFRFSEAEIGWKSGGQDKRVYFDNRDHYWYYKAKSSFQKKVKIDTADGYKLKYRNCLLCPWQLITWDPDGDGFDGIDSEVPPDPGPNDADDDGVVGTDPDALMTMFDLQTFFYLDKVNLHGAAARNYGLPDCFKYDVSGWKEHTDAISGEISYTGDSIEGSGGWCFIATACYGSNKAFQVRVLRQFRDRYLIGNSVGSFLVNLYYQLSPPLASLISKHESLKKIVRVGLMPVYVFALLVVGTTALQKIIALSLAFFTLLALVRLIHTLYYKGVTLNRQKVYLHKE
ncbi:MAG: CFI-box-CTERM domain-containing protein [Thermodesulfobacteriota bacterium]|nr:CFI-box-CTERM domain-containing protein [Thermodesulfobacteriota bacterium]